MHPVFAINDEWVQKGLERQVLDRESRYYGGVISPDNGLASPNHSTGTPVTMAVWAAALCNPASRYYRDRELIGRLELAAGYMLRAQHPDGTISPGFTNFHSPPDTAFVVVGYAQVCQLLERDGGEETAQAARDVRLFLRRTIPALVSGGCHTPNHRWVLCAALGFLRQLFGAREAAERAEQWLAEGMDITPDGEWTERSNGIYNAVSDMMLAHAARLLGRPELLEPVRANLRMMTYLIHPDGDVVTDYSGRQDFGQRHDLSSYYLPYAMLAHEDADPQFQAAAELALGFMKHPGSAPANAAVRLLLDERLQHRAVEPAALPTEYRVLINGDFPRERYLAEMGGAGHQGRIVYSRLHPDFGAPVARIRHGRTSATVSAETPSFFALRHGAVRLLGVQAASYFEPGFVPMNRLTPTENGYLLAGEQQKGYFGPVPSSHLPPTAGEPVSPWYLLPHHRRPQTHLQRHRVEAEVRETEDGWEVAIRASEPEETVTQLSLVLAADGVLSGGDLDPAEAGTWLWKGGTVRLEADGDWMEIEGGALEHTAKTVREANYPANCRTLLINLVTPFERRIRIRLSPSADV
ncbi:hypothetical protein [Cohnella zeiphila]|uniref:Heparinase n=1 Tax=Cohnella zeiphila TaxID=2761120 RepID=A0A7X0VYC6_9BACL|nr:hypothetical protein [Cohnella zeiphila]MBB6734886.1 hypothetical protein [Cohnella zeiphila]